MYFILRKMKITSNAFSLVNKDKKKIIKGDKEYKALPS